MNEATLIIIVGLFFDIAGAFFIVRTLLRDNPLGLSFLKYLKIALFKSAYLSPVMALTLEDAKFKKKVEDLLLDDKGMKEKLKEREESFKDPKWVREYLKNQSRDGFWGIALLVFGFILQIIGNWIQNPPSF